MTSILLRRERRQTEIEGRVPYEDGGRDWSDGVAIQRTLRIDDSTRS